MNAIFSLSLMVRLFAVASFSLVLPAQAVTLDSSGTNDEFIGVANYAFSYTSVPYTLTASCYIEFEENNSSWAPIPASCDTSTTASCWADTCQNCLNQDNVFADAYISVGSMRKTMLQYYADNHKDSNQGYCDFSIGTSSFSISFDYKDTGEDFSLSLIPGTSGDSGWITSGACPPASPPPPDGIIPESLEANTDPASQYNLICNEEFLVSLAADPDTSNAAGISVINNVNALANGVQELSADTAVNQSQASGKPLRQAGARQVSSLAAATVSQALSSVSELRRFSSRTDEVGRWLVTADADGETMHGVLISGADSEVTELAACQLTGDDGNPQSIDRRYIYDCALSSLDGTFTRNEDIITSGSLLRVRPRLGPKTVVRATDADVVSSLKVAVVEFAKSAHVGSPDASDTLVWHGQSGQSRVVMVKHGLKGDVEVVAHSPNALSPVFMSCSESLGRDVLNPEYVCKANLRCTGAPCDPASWSAKSKLTLPRALFRERPCQRGRGVPALNPRLEVRGSSTSELLAFQANVVLAAGSRIRPDQTGFRLLVEDARGYTVVDMEVPGSKGGGLQSNSWEVARDGKRFTFQSPDSRGNTGPRITIEQRGTRTSVWTVALSGIAGRFNTANLARPLAASFTLNPSDSNSGLCATTYDKVDQPIVTATPISRRAALLEWTQPDMGGHTFAGYTVTWGYAGSSIAAGTLVVQDYDTLSTVISDLGCNPNCSFTVTANSLDVALLPAAPGPSSIPALGWQGLLLLTLILLSIGVIKIRRLG